MSTGRLEDAGWLYEELCLRYCGKEEKFMATAVGWWLLWVVRLAPYVQLEAENRVRKLEKELKLDKDIRMSMTLLASILADKG